MQSDSNTNFREAFGAQLVVNAQHAALHRDGRSDSVRGVLWRHRRRAKQSHQAITQILIECPAVRKDDVGHRGEVTIEQLHDLFRRGVFRDASEAANVREQHRDRLRDAAQLERLGVLEHLLHNVFRQKAAVVGARNFFFCQALVRAHVLDRDGGLGRDGADQFEIIGFES